MFVCAGQRFIQCHFMGAGKIIQNFDHSSDITEKEFMCASCNPTGQSCVMGSYDRLRVFNYCGRRELWEEGPSKDITNLYTITALSWRKDGSKLAVVSGGGGGSTWIRMEGGGGRRRRRGVGEKGAANIDNSNEH